jgi:hypothetical protein
VLAQLLSSAVDGKSSTYLEPMVIRSLHMAFFASSAKENLAKASPVAFPSYQQQMLMSDSFKSNSSPKKSMISVFVTE